MILLGIIYITTLILIIAFCAVVAFVATGLTIAILQIIVYSIAGSIVNITDFLGSVINKKTSNQPQRDIKATTHE